VGNFASSYTIQNLKHGVSSETIQLAALGPATMLCDNFIYVSYFLPIAVTNQLATAEATSDNRLKIQSTSNALGIALMIGLSISLMINYGGGNLLSYCIGKEGAIVNGVDMTSTVKSLSWDYAKIRGFFAPLVVMGIVAQTVSLTTLDTFTPALAVILATVTNVIGDVLLVAKWKLGLRGASVATAAAGCISSLVLLKQTKEKMRIWKTTIEQGDISQEEMPLISIPNMTSLIRFVKLAGPIFFVIVGKMICYSLMTVRAADFGMLSLATHNIMIRIFFFFCTVGDSFSQAAQTFLPTVLYSTFRDEKQKDMNEDETNPEVVDDERAVSSTYQQNGAYVLLKRIFLLSCLSACGCAILSRFIVMNCASIFTNDTTIKTLLRSSKNIAFMMCSIFIHPMIMVLEGALIAARDLRFLVMAYGMTIAALVTLLRYSPTFSGVWKSLLCFQVIRFMLFSSRVFRRYCNRGMISGNIQSKSTS